MIGTKKFMYFKKHQNLHKMDFSLTAFLPSQYCNLPKLKFRLLNRTIL